MSNKTYLSKSQFLKGLQCHKALWLFKNHPEIRTEPNKTVKFLLETGRQTGIYAQQLFPNGESILYKKQKLQENITKTQELLNSNINTIYEATFCYDNILVMIDILHKGTNGWEIYEVKSGTDIKPTNIKDAAIQYYVAKNSGIYISNVFIIHINGSYILKETINPQQLFSIKNITVSVKEKLPRLIKETKKIQQMLKKEMPLIKIGEHCNRPYECEFKSFCWSAIPENSVFDIRGMSEADKFKLYAQGYHKITDVPLTTNLTKSQYLQIQSEITNELFVDKKALNNFLAQLYYPLYFLDFECFMHPVPKFIGTHPYQSIVFQYSLHYQLTIDSSLKHKEFLGTPKKDPRRSIAEELLQSIPGDSCILVFAAATEKAIFRELAALFPDLAARLLQIANSIVDLMPFFKEKNVYAREMKGRHSIKAILPALVPEMAYDELDVADGFSALQKYLHLAEETDPQNQEKIRKSLKDYCALDTFAMVKILEKLRLLAKDPIQNNHPA